MRCHQKGVILMGRKWMKKRKQSRKPHEGLTCSQRHDFLLSLGYVNYADYLKSPLWFSIRARVLGASPDCACGVPANQVHHKVYTEANLSGKTTRGLWAICVDCHRRIEFDGKRKTALHEANRKLRSIVEGGISRA
jgi:5-methylcytosine-specific restriction endonuclease McrA